MKKIHRADLKNIEGIVKSSEEFKTAGGWENVELTLDNEIPYWIRGEHRIDVGERVRLYYSGGQGRITPPVIKIYEILNETGEKIKYRRFM